MATSTNHSYLKHLKWCCSRRSRRLSPSPCTIPTCLPPTATLTTATLPSITRHHLNTGTRNPHFTSSLPQCTAAKALCTVNQCTAVATIQTWPKAKATTHTITPITILMVTRTPKILMVSFDYISHLFLSSNLSYDPLLYPMQHRYNKPRIDWSWLLGPVEMSLDSILIDDIYDCAPPGNTIAVAGWGNDLVQFEFQLFLLHVGFVVSLTECH